MPAFDGGIIFGFLVTVIVIVTTILNFQDKRKQKIAGFVVGGSLIVLIALAIFFAYHYNWESDLLRIPSFSRQPVETPAIEETATPFIPEVPNMFSTDSPSQSIYTIHESYYQPQLALRRGTDISIELVLYAASMGAILLFSMGILNKRDLRPVEKRIVLGVDLIMVLYLIFLVILSF